MKDNKWYYVEDINYLDAYYSVKNKYIGKYIKIKSKNPTYMNKGFYCCYIEKWVGLKNNHRTPSCLYAVKIRKITKSEREKIFVELL